MGSRLRSVVAAALLTAAVVPSVALAGPTGGALSPVLINVHTVAGEYGIPDNALAVAATVTAIRPADRGWIKVYPCDQPEPTTANLNYEADQVINNLVLSRIADDGTICVATHAIADYVIDLAGYVPAGSDITPLVSPARVLDTRKNGGPSPIPDDTTAVLDLADAGVPAGSNIAVFNLTAVSRNTYGHVTAYPCDQQPGTTSSINFAPGRAVANLVITRLAADGTVCFHNKNQVDLVVDVAGYGTDGFTTLPTPRRILNTRDTPGLVPAGNTIIDPALPAGASAAIYNLTVVGASAPGHATAYPCDQPVPKASNVNYPIAVAAGAASITKLDSTGHFCIHTLTPAELIIDLIGYTTGTTHYIPITPARLHDTRKGWEATCTIVAYAHEDGMQLLDLAPPGGAPPSYFSLGPQSAPNRFSTPAQTFRDECGAVYFYVTEGFGSGAAPGLHRFSRLGPLEPVRHDLMAPAIDSGSFPIIGLTKLPGFDVILGYSSNGATWDLLSGEQINGAIEGFVSDDDYLGLARYLPPLTMSENGSVIVSAYPIESGRAITVWDWYTETLDGVIRASSAAVRFNLSPDGTYLAVWAPSGYDDTDVIVYTRFGDEVDRFALPLKQCDFSNVTGPPCPAPPDQDVRWIGNGELAIIEHARYVYRRPLFGDPVLVNSLSDIECRLTGGCSGP